MLSFKARFLFFKQNEAVPPEFSVHVWKEEFRRVGTGREGIKKKNQIEYTHHLPGHARGSVHARQEKKMRKCLQRCARHSGVA